MSEEGTTSSQKASHIQRSQSEQPDAPTFLDVDVTEQIKIQKQLEQSLESAYELAIQEAIRRSMLTCSETDSVKTDNFVPDNGESASALSPLSSSELATDMDNITCHDVNDSPSGDLNVEPVTSSQRVRSMINRFDLSDRASGGSYNDTQSCHISANVDENMIDDSDNSSEDEAVSRSRKGQYRRNQQQRLQSNREYNLDRNSDAVYGHGSGMEGAGHDQSEQQHSPVFLDRYQSEQRSPHENGRDSKSERRPSLERLNGYVAERRPSLDRVNDYRAERRPSLDRASDYRAERRPSLERVNDYRAERRPSLERAHDYRVERRPSLERAHDYRSERRPSLELANVYRSERRPSLERASAYRSERRPSLDRMTERKESRQGERRPSLERLEQHGLERRPSLERMQSSLQRLQSLNSRDDSSTTGQGINTLHPWPLNQQGVPSNWDVMQIPNSMGDDGLYRLVELSPVDREYSAISVDFEEAGLKVSSVERLQNLMLLERFKHEKEHLLRSRPPDFDLNERYLYHGTQANQHYLCEEGLDHRLSFQGCFGRGIYFSDNPRKCMQYATTSSYNPDSTGTRPMILVCRVLLGESKVYGKGMKDPALKREPEKPKSKGGWRYYDSVQGVPVDYPEFVVYENRRSMIEYIVTFEEVACRAPPSINSFYTNQTPSLYKLEPIILPIPEKELDKLYMLEPDTDSDGSCDEHTREVERLRDNVKRGKAKRLGIPYRPPTEEEKRCERLHWKRVCYYSCPPGSPLYQMMIIKKREEKEERKKRKQQAKKQKGGQVATLVKTENLEEPGRAASGSVTEDQDTLFTDVKSEREDFEVENDSVAEVLSTLIADFLNITTTDNVPTARRYILDNSMDLDKALCQFFRDL